MGKKNPARKNVKRNNFGKQIHKDKTKLTATVRYDKQMCSLETLRFFTILSECQHNFDKTAQKESGFTSKAMFKIKIYIKKPPNFKKKKLSKRKFSEE